jgi:hypothetical protein
MTPGRFALANTFSTLCPAGGSFGALFFFWILSGFSIGFYFLLGQKSSGPPGAPGGP